jgi:hypothetical protein
MISSRVCTLFVLLTLSTPIAVAHAQDMATASHVRGTDEASTTLIRDLVARSATGRELVERLDRSDLVVYVRRRLFTTTMLNGRIGFVRADCSRRYVAIEIAAPRNYVEELASLGHELQHAVEIAGEPDVCDATALGELPWNGGAGCPTPSKPAPRPRPESGCGASCSRPPQRIKNLELRIWNSGRTRTVRALVRILNS